MRKAIIGTFLAAAMAWPAVAQETDIQGVIQHQLNAFQQDDFATAFTFASPSIQGIFRSPDNFGTMVRQGFPMVWRPADVTFLELREDGARQFQRVMIQDGSGAVHVLEYQMIPGEDGWVINGVQILDSGVLGA